METLLTPSERAAYRQLAKAARKVQTIEELRRRKRRQVADQRQTRQQKGGLRHVAK